MSSERFAALLSWAGIATVLVLCLGLSVLPARAATPGPVGSWVTASHDAVIQISPCGDKLCGAIEGMVLNQTEPTPTDWAGQSQCGLVILQADANARRQDDGSRAWYGHITNPRNGSVYQIKLTLDRQGELRLRGYVGLPLFGATQTWSAFQGQLAAKDCRLSGISS
ncbi:MULTISPECIES: DUF2147 domain-containing protein [Acidocella]|uniref:DUF2147 domain-containing protein n=1 Tax=Acidocella TaxID=50709 RepID=UPI00028E0779|nr:MULTISPECIES: DUF2147 domain-containing protein [Acidocella]EKM98760.1 hypothetical protein MXAZACID_13798 [Acidocella sp. MX-AZ02]WBO58786.1 DUF2147 domain-containing protein [Acidocella sp. MX-AZ03]